MTNVGAGTIDETDGWGRSVYNGKIGRKILVFPEKICGIFLLIIPDLGG
jgi:hypothetical protein